MVLPARRVAVGDIIIIISYGIMEFEVAKAFRPSVIFPDESTNRFKVILLKKHIITSLKLAVPLAFWSFSYLVCLQWINSG